MSAQEWLDRTQAITDAATEGPWAWEKFTWKMGRPVSDSQWIGVGNPRKPGGYIASVPREFSGDAEFIAHARTALPQAVAALRAVTDLHQPRNTVTQSASGHLVDTPGPCTACDWDWPCPTITTITDAIGDHPRPQPTSAHSATRLARGSRSAKTMEPDTIDPMSVDNDHRYLVSPMGSEPW